MRKEKKKINSWIKAFLIVLFIRWIAIPLDPNGRLALLFLIVLGIIKVIEKILYYTDRAKNEQ